MPEGRETLETTCRVSVDERVMAALDKKRPIGQSRTSYVNLLLQKAVTNEPDRIIPRDV